MATVLNNGEIFIHIPRCGGTSIFYACGKRFLVPDYPFNHQHLTYNTIKQLAVVYSNKPFITQVRNPYDRFLSYFNYLKSVIADNIASNIKIDCDLKSLQLLSRIDISMFVNTIINKDFRNKFVVAVEECRGGKGLRGLTDPSLCYNTQTTWTEGCDNLTVFKLEDKTIWKYLDCEEEKLHTSEYIEEDELSSDHKRIVYNYYKQDFLEYGYEP